MREMYVIRKENNEIVYRTYDGDMLADAWDELKCNSKNGYTAAVELWVDDPFSQTSVVLVSKVLKRSNF